MTGPADITMPPDIGTREVPEMDPRDEYILKALVRITEMHARCEAAFKEKGVYVEVKQRDELAGLLAVKCLRMGAPMSMVSTALHTYATSPVPGRPWALKSATVRPL